MYGDHIPTVILLKTDLAKTVLGMHVGIKPRRPYPNQAAISGNLINTEQIYNIKTEVNFLFTLSRPSVCYYFIYFVNICLKHFFTEAAARELLNQLSHNFDKKHYEIRNSDSGFIP